MKKYKYLITASLLLISSLILISTGLSYSIFNLQVKGTTKNKITTASYAVLLKDAILNNNEIITATPTLTDSSNNTTDTPGLYKSTATNSGNPTYYFRGNVENNYVDFAGFTWRIIRINDDETVRLMLENAGGTNLKYASANDSTNSLYISNNGMGGLAYALAMWCNNNLYKADSTGRNYTEYVAKGNYFCEQAKVTYYNDTSIISAGSVTMTYYTNYTPTFKCATDANGKGIYNTTAYSGLITYDEIVFAGGYPGKANDSYYLYDSSTNIWTSSPIGVHKYGGPLIWHISTTGSLANRELLNTGGYKPVINLKSDVKVVGTGTSDNHYVVKDYPAT